MKYYLMKYRILIGLFVLILLVEAVLLIANWRPIAGWVIAVSGAETPTETPSTNNAQIQDLEEMLLDNSLSKEARESILEKISMAKRMEAEQAAGASLEQKEKKAPPLPTSAAEFLVNPLNVPDQIFEGSQGMIRPSTAQISNCWQGVRSGKVMEIYAGALPDDAGQGVLLIFVDDPENTDRTMQMVKAPGKSGLLRILSVDETAATLAAADGSQLLFNLKTLKFVK
ncbi:MAG: hypothetical protein IH586_05375 [Anaerolineaceae bacterium]|nr:hypothetical protein [Anaerolineaceae bacterium]